MLTWVEITRSLSLNHFSLKKILQILMRLCFASKKAKLKQIVHERCGICVSYRTGLGFPDDEGRRPSSHLEQDIKLLCQNPSTQSSRWIRLLGLFPVGRVDITYTWWSIVSLWFSSHSLPTVCQVLDCKISSGPSLGFYVGRMPVWVHCFVCVISLGFRIILRMPTAGLSVRVSKQ